MKIGINASFTRKPNTGLGQVSWNFLKTLIANNDLENNYVLYLEEDFPKSIKLKLPKNFEKRIFLPVWKRDDLIRKIWWEKYLLPRFAEKDDCEAFISIYHCPTVMPKKIKHVMVVHDLIPRLFPQYLNNWRKKQYQKASEKAMKKADHIIAISKRTEKDLIQQLHIPGEKISVAYNGIDELFLKEISPEASAKVLKKYHLKPGYIMGGGGLEVRKNAEGLMRAYKFLVEKNKREHFVDEMPKIVIWGKLLPHLAPLVTDAEKLAKELDLTQEIQLLDAVPQEDLPALYSGCKFFVFPSFYEGFGLPVLEAMTQKKPVITSKTSSLPEVGGDAVLYCDPESTQDLAMVMKNLLINPELREALSERALERSKKFSWESFVEKVMNLIKV